MAEIVSKQAAKVAAGTKLTAADVGIARTVVITSPDTATYANGDTLASPVIIPAGSRVLCGGFVSCADMGTSITLDVGLRKVSDGHGNRRRRYRRGGGRGHGCDRAALNSGRWSRTAWNTSPRWTRYLYATLAGGTPTANAQLRIEVPILFL